MNDIAALPAALESCQHSTPGDQPVDDGARLLADSGLFDNAWYLRCNPDVAASGRHQEVYCHFDPCCCGCFCGWSCPNSL